MINNTLKYKFYLYIIYSLIIEIAQAIIIYISINFYCPRVYNIDLLNNYSIPSSYETYVGYYIFYFHLFYFTDNVRQRSALSGSAVCYLNLNVFISKIKALFRKWFGHYS